MKTIFITVPEASVTRNILRGSFWKHFNDGRNFRVVLIITPQKEEEYKKEFSGQDIILEPLPYIFPDFTEKIANFIAKNALRTGTAIFNQMRQYHDGGNFFAMIIKRALRFVCGDSFLLQKVFRRLELLRSPHPMVRELFERHRPDAVFSTVAIHTEMDIPILREATRRGISTIATVRGWDNFTSHGFLRIVPDKLLLQNQYLKDMGVKHHFLSPHMMEVVGFPQNDWYFRKDWIEPREEFLKKLGVDQKKRMILFGAMGDFLFPKEGEIAEVFEELVESGKLPQDFVMVFRAHPAFPSPLDEMKRMKHVVPDRNAIYLSSQIDSWEMGEKEVAHLINSIVHSEMVVTSGSTMALDAVALGKSAISAAFEKSMVNYWISGRRFRRYYTHYEAMMATGGVKTADSPEDLVAAIMAYLANPAEDSEGRKKLAEEFLAPCDGHSGERIAQKVRAHFSL